MTKFVDDATNREKRDLDFMRQLMKEQTELAQQREQKQTELAQRREQKQIELALQREKEIRDDLRQLAASEVGQLGLFFHQLSHEIKVTFLTVSALQQQLHAQTFMPPDSRAEKFEKPRGTYFSDYSLRPRQSTWASSPKIADEYCTPVPVSTTADSMLDVVVTPLSYHLLIMLLVL